MAKIYKKGEESSEEPSERLRVVSLFPSYLFIIKENESSFTVFVSKVATTLSGTSSSAKTLDFPVTSCHEELDVILWDESLKVYDQFHMVICHLHVDYISLNKILVCQVHS